MKPKFCHVSFHARDVSSASAGFSSTAAPANPAAASSPAPARRFQPRHPSRSGALMSERNGCYST